MKRVLIFVHEMYEDLELWYPKIRLEEEGFKVVVAGPKEKEEYKSKHGYPCKADVSFQQVENEEFDALVIPGGYAPDKLRRYPVVLKITERLFNQKKLVAFICHGGWVPISAKIVNGKNLTSVDAIKDDLENAQGIWHDEAVVEDGNLISSRTPKDLSMFGKAIVNWLKK